MHGVLFALLAALNCPAQDLGNGPDVGTDLVQASHALRDASRVMPKEQYFRGAATQVEFPEPGNRNQKLIGDCHSFGSTAVLEAAYYRKYKRHIVISEADVFLQRTVLSGAVFSDFCTEGRCVLHEGNDVAGDIQYVLDHGALRGDSYKEFAQRYIKYRDGETETMKGIEKEYEQMTWIEKLFYDPRKHWKQLETRPEDRRILTVFLEGRGSAESAERGRLKAEFNGFHRRSRNSRDFGYSAANAAVSADQCRSRGVGQLQAIRGELDLGRPVTVSMDLSGLSSWNMAGNKNAFHAFVVNGYSETKGGVLFHTRNSWGGFNPDVTDDQLCRVMAVDTVLAPDEQPTF